MTAMAEREILQVLLAAEEALHVTEIGRRAKRSRPTVYKALQSLQQQGIVQRSDKVGPIPRYGANPEHTTVKGLRKAGADTAGGGDAKLLVVEVEEDRPHMELRADPARGVGLEVWVTTLEDARALGKLQKAIERLGLEEVVNRALDG
ncbi:MAG TPA: helix-turn-helix domain-containing protein [Candidatus Thermoplasmatota archaeon]|nr:helix-turn-helix domain-containing protein [Candidatus Thermoplasmatota archaeon]